MQMHFDATASVNAVKYYWDFGDGTIKNNLTNPATTHTFAVPGLYYNVCLSIENLYGDIDQSCGFLGQIGLKELAL